MFGRLRYGQIAGYLAAGFLTGPHAAGLMLAPGGATADAAGIIAPFRRGEYVGLEVITGERG